MRRLCRGACCCVRQRARASQICRRTPCYSTSPGVTAAFGRMLGSALVTACSALHAPTLTSPLVLCILQEVSFYGDGTLLHAVRPFERHLLAAILCSRAPCS